jgi:acetylornithine deacetylase/succinyl-diaminopimelate desuccinylase-like protein
VTFQLDVKNSGGHSSVPRRDNAIYQLAEGLVRLSKFEFPLHLNDTTRAWFAHTSQTVSEKTAADIRAVLADKPDDAALARLSAIAPFNAELRTTCVATMLEGGHAANALPQLATAKVNCRIMPGEPAEEVKATLIKVLADDEITVTQIEREVASEPSKLNEEIVGAVEKLSHEFWPEATLIPVMSSGATDGAFLRNAGIPTYGHSGMAMETGDSARLHGRDERVPMKSFYNGNEYLYRLVKMLAGGG